jgi:hypothetical protein
VCQDMAWMLLQQLIHFMCDSPVNLAAGEYQGDEKSLFTGIYYYYTPIRSTFNSHRHSVDV